MAGTGTKRITELTEASTIQSGDFIAVDSNARGTKKVPTDALATSAALTAETNARAGADEQMSARMDGIEEQTALIQNPTKTLSGALVSFTDGAAMPMVACTAEIVPKQSGTGTPSPENVRPISGWSGARINDNGKNFLENTGTSTTASGITITVNDDKSVTISGTATATVWFNVNYHFYLSKGTYILSGGSEFQSANAGSVVSYLDLRNSSGSIYNNVRSTTAETTFTLTENIEDFRVSLNVLQGKTVDYTLYPMIRLASDTDPTYEPYTGNTDEINLGLTVYGGTLDVVSGVLTVDRAMVDLGTLTWAQLSGYIQTTDLQNVIKKPASNNTPCDIIAEKYIASTWAGTANNGVAVAQSGAMAINGVSSANGKLVYALATPQTYQLTPTEVKTLLGENNVWADSGDVEITYRRDISIVINNLESALNG